MDSNSKQQLNSAFRRGGKIKDPPPEIEIVSPHEVYLLDEEGDRVRKICGRQKSGFPKGYVCEQSAGHGTNHPGVGNCKKHDSSIPNPKNVGLWDRLNKDQGLPSTLAEYLENASDIEERHLTSVDEDIKALYGLFTYQMSKRKKAALAKGDIDEEQQLQLSNADLELALKIMDKILKAKEVRLKLSRELTLDTSTIKMFVNQIFQVATQKLPEHQAKMLLNAFLDQVIIPFQTKGRIKGGDFEYSPMSGQLMGDIKDE